MRPDSEEPTDIDSMEYAVDSDVCLLLFLLPDEFRGGLVMDVQKIDGCVMKRVKA